jgi:ribosomal protein L11 methyltransferase
MTETNGPARPTPAYRPPYDELFIYYLEGRVAESALTAIPAYIGTWEEENSSFIFFSTAAEAVIDGVLQSQPSLTLIDRYQMRYEDWQGGRVAAFRSGRFYVQPPWECAGAERPAAGPRRADEIALTLDPGVVFGTGTHPTTRDCLTALETLYNNTPIETVLDLGTGTGILAIAAARLGSRRVVAVDFNRLAVQTARHNIHLNRVGHRVLPVQGRAEQLLASPAALVVANIHYDVMQWLLQHPGFWEKRHWILSGLLRSQAREVENLIDGRRGRIVKRWTHDHIWHTYLGTNLLDGIAGGGL